MDSERYDIRAYKSASLIETLTVYSDKDATQLVNLTGYTASFIVKDRPGKTTLATLTQASGITLGGAAGTIVIKRTPGQTAAWLSDQLAYELTITSGSGDTTLLLHGNLNLIST